MAPAKIRQHYGQPVVVQRAFIRVTKDLKAAAMLSQAMYWTDTLPPDREGWFYKTQIEWEEETSLTRPEQERARRILTDLGFWEEDHRGMPRKVWFKVDEEKLDEAIKEAERARHMSRSGAGKASKVQHAEKQHTGESLVISRQQCAEKQHAQYAEIQHTACMNSAYWDPPEPIEDKDSCGEISALIEYMHRIHDIDPSSLRSDGAEASQAQPSADADSSFQEDADASDNALVPVVASGPGVGEDLEARLAAEYGGMAGSASPPGNGNTYCLIRRALSEDLFEGLRGSEIGASSTLEEPPLCPSPPRDPKTQPRASQTAKRAITETVPTRKRDPVSPERQLGDSAVGKKTPNSSHDSPPEITLQHPALVEVRRLLALCGCKRCKQCPPRILWGRIVGTLGDRAGEWDQERLEETYRKWLGKGYQCQNLEGWLFNWFVNGIPEERSATVYGSRDPEPVRKRINQTQFCGKGGCRFGWIKGQTGVYPCPCNEREKGAWR